MSNLESGDCDSLEDPDDDPFFLGDEFPWIEQLGSHIYQGKERIGSLDAKFIGRSWIKNSFWDHMNEPSEGTCALALELFDRYGRLRKDFYKHDVRKGSGVWGPELDDEEIVLFESLQIDKDARRKKVGTRVVTEILQACGWRGCYAFVMPGYLRRECPPHGLNEEEEEAFRNNMEDIAIRFWRSLGFRRVGVSGWFAFTDDPDHPSKRLDASQDWDPPNKSRKKEELLPDRITAALQEPADPESYDINRNVPAPTILLKDLLPDDPENPIWLLTDKHGNTALHLAAELSRADDIKYVLSKKPSLTNLRNDEGFTPLETLHEALEEKRTGSRRASGEKADQFRGFSESNIASVGMLTGVEVSDLDHIDVQRIKYGCICGACIDGFLSPRMHLTLLRHAKEQQLRLQEWCAASTDGSIGFPKTFISTGAEKCLPILVKDHLTTNQLVRKGFVNMWTCVVECLAENMAPSKENVMQLWESRLPRLRSGKGKAFLDSGGSVKVVANMLFCIARSRDELAGTSSYRKNPYEEEISKLPCCRNDKEYEFVRGVCGY